MLKSKSKNKKKHNKKTFPTIVLQPRMELPLCLQTLKIKIPDHLQQIYDVDPEFNQLWITAAENIPPVLAFIYRIRGFENDRGWKMSKELAANAPHIEEYDINVVSFYNGNICLFTTNQSLLAAAEQHSDQVWLVPNQGMLWLWQKAINLDLKQFTVYNPLDYHYNLVWEDIPNQKFSYWLENNDLHFNPAGYTQSQCIHNFAHDKLQWPIINKINDYIQAMDLTDKINAGVFINYPRQRGPNYQHTYDEDKPEAIVVSSLALSETELSTKKDIKNRNLKYTRGDKNIYSVTFSPVIYFLNNEDQNKLIIHELVHCKIGNAHQHDSYFWSQFEKYSGMSRKSDYSYSLQQEISDNKSWAFRHPKYPLPLIINGTIENPNFRLDLYETMEAEERLKKNKVIP